MASETYARLFHALSDPTRLTILQHLALGGHRVRDLVEHLGFAQSTVSKHLSCLQECGLVSLRVEGRASWYSLADADDLAGVLQAAEHLLGATGARVSLCTQLMRPES
ncbi:ArsR/SmtB family transcription factor [Tessaracoccus coleopterorum]|uniref:ArsR/SmtB family transcription factor n=1 Tax=Tessaracoccus coleopterorum TaxID=2714950 RepID=UPI002F91356F